MNVKELIHLLTECDLALEVKVRIGDALARVDDVSEVRLYGVKTEGRDAIRTEEKYVELTSKDLGPET